MRTIQVKLYPFEELGEEAKTKAIEDWRKVKNESGDLLHFFNDDIEERIREAGFTEPDAQYSLSFWKGDGLSFSASGYTKLKELFQKKMGLGKNQSIELIIENCVLSINGNTGRYCRYCYAAESDIEMNLDYCSDPRLKYFY